MPNKIKKVRKANKADFINHVNSNNFLHPSASHDIMPFQAINLNYSDGLQNIFSNPTFRLQ